MFSSPMDHHTRGTTTLTLSVSSLVDRIFHSVSSKMDSQESQPTVIRITALNLQICPRDVGRLNDNPGSVMELDPDRRMAGSKGDRVILAYPDSLESPEESEIHTLKQLVILVVEPNEKPCSLEVLYTRLDILMVLWRGENFRSPIVLSNALLPEYHCRNILPNSWIIARMLVFRSRKLDRCPRFMIFDAGANQLEQMSRVDRLAVSRRSPKRQSRPVLLFIVAEKSLVAWHRNH